MNFYEIQYAKRKIEPKMSSFLVKRNEAFNCVWKGVRVYLLLLGKIIGNN